jgi:hypothetical protein
MRTKSGIPKTQTQILTQTLHLNTRSSPGLNGEGWVGLAALPGVAVEGALNMTVHARNLSL